MQIVLFLSVLSRLLALLAAVAAYDHVEVRREAAPAEDDVSIFQPLIFNSRLLPLLPLDRHVAQDDRVLEEQVGGPGRALYVQAKVDQRVQLADGLAEVAAAPQLWVAQEQLSLVHARQLPSFRRERPFVCGEEDVQSYISERPRKPDSDQLLKDDFAAGHLPFHLVRILDHVAKVIVLPIPASAG